MSDKSLDPNRSDFLGHPWRESLEMLARLELEWLQERGLHLDHDAECESDAKERVRRLTILRDVLGEVQFRQAISGVNAPWALSAIDLSDEELACPNYYVERHQHELCKEAIADGTGSINAIIERWPDLTREQARHVLESDPFTGMTVEQARVAFRGQFHLLKSVGAPPVDREIWAGQTAWYAGDNVLLLIFLNGRVEEVVDLDWSDSTFRLRGDRACRPLASTAG